MQRRKRYPFPQVGAACISLGLSTRPEAPSASHPVPLGGHDLLTDRIQGQPSREEEEEYIQVLGEPLRAGGDGESSREERGTTNSAGTCWRGVCWPVGERPNRQWLWIWNLGGPGCRTDVETLGLWVGPEATGGMSSSRGGC